MKRMLHKTILLPLKSNSLKFMLCIILFLFTAVTFSQTAIKVHNYYFYYNKEVTKPTITISTMTLFSKNFYFSTYTIVRPSWAQCVLGFDASVNNWMILGFKAGIQTETNGSMGRYSPIVYIQKKNLNAFGVYEWGGFSDRSQGTLCYKVKDFNTGIMEAHSGKIVAIGPMLEYFIPKTIFTVYGSAMTVLRDGKFASQFGIYIRFFPTPSIYKFCELKNNMFYNMPEFRPIN